MKDSLIQSGAAAYGAPIAAMDVAARTVAVPALFQLAADRPACPSYVDVPGGSSTNGVKLCCAADATMPNPKQNPAEFAVWLVQFVHALDEQKHALITANVRNVIGGLSAGYAWRFQLRPAVPDLNLRRSANIEAALLHIAGTDAAVPCATCAKSSDPFKGCRSLSYMASGSCANCHYNSSGGRCTLRATATTTTTTGDAGVRMPKRAAPAPLAPAPKRPAVGKKKQEEKRPVPIVIEDDDNDDEIQSMTVKQLLKKAGIRPRTKAARKLRKLLKLLLKELDKELQ